MAQTINTNILSLNAQRNLNGSQSAMQQAVQRLSSGLRVNSSKDDAAGLAIAERMQSQVRGMNVAIRNANDAISFSQVAEGGLAQINDMAQRMRELAVQSANATNNSADRENLNQEFQALATEINRTVSSTRFNGDSVLTRATPLTYQVGAETGDVITVDSADMTTPVDLTSQKLDGDDNTSSLAAMDAIDTMMKAVNDKRAEFGAIQNRFQSVISTLSISVENQSAARSRIMDADFAQETASLTRAQVLQQAGQSMLAQANSSTSSVLTLLQRL